MDGQLRLIPLKDRDAASIHFPGSTNGVQAFSFKNSTFTEESDELYWHTCDTDSGSSGAPVFNSNWRLVALHVGHDGTSNLGFKADFDASQLTATLKAVLNGLQILRDLGIAR